MFSEANGFRIEDKRGWGVNKSLTSRLWQTVIWQDTALADQRRRLVLLRAVNLSLRAWICCLAARLDGSAGTINCCVPTSMRGWSSRSWADSPRACFIDRFFGDEGFAQIDVVAVSDG